MNTDSYITDAKNHRHKLVLIKNVQHLIHGTSVLGRFNAALAVRITRVVGSMWCAYFFALLAIISLPAAIATHDLIVIVGWIAQTFIQLVLLPIIIVGQNIQAEASDKRAENDHETLQAIHTLNVELYRLNEKQINILEMLERHEKILK